MAATLEVVKTLKQDAALLCTPCLSDTVADHAALLGDLIEVTANMAAVRHESVENERLYQASFQNMMTAVFVIAVFSGELAKRPVPFAAAVSLN